MQSKVTNLRLTSQLDRPPDFVGQKVHNLLKEIGTIRTPPRLAALSALAQASDHLLALKEKGFSSKSLVLAISQCGLDIGTDELNDVLCQAMLTRMQAYEEKIEMSLARGRAKAASPSGLIERGLRRALKTGKGLHVHYQPQVNMLTGAIVGAEALLRWENDFELVSPAVFIPVAEESGLIEEIGGWVLREACSEAKRWERMGLGTGSGIKVSVNLSVKQFSDRLLDEIHGVLCDVGLPTNLLGVEITESFLAGNNSRDLLKILHDAGLHIAIDDFGTGYSCLSRLSALPLDTIKLDRAFIVEIGLSPGASAVIQTLITLADKLGMRTIAEGVETQEQAEALVGLGCTVAQGYLYARPLPAAEFIRYAMGRTA